MKEQLTNQSIRKSNMSNLLMSIIDSRKIMRSELAEQNGISVMTVKKIVDELMALEIVQEKYIQGSGVGRKPKALQISDKLGLCVCISLTSKLFFSYIIYNVYGDIMEERQYKVDEQFSYQDNLYHLITLLKADIDKINLKLLGVGISVPGAYYSEEDVINYDLIPEFNNLHLMQIFSREFQIENIIITHDVFVAAQAEYDLLEKDSSLFYFYVGDGVGGAFIEKNIWHIGENQVAGEIGQFIINTEHGESTLESCTAIPFLVDQLQSSYPGASFLTLLQEYDKQSSDVVALIDSAAEKIAQSLYNVAWVLNPHRIVINSSYQRYAEIIAHKCNEYNQRLNNLPIRMHIEVLPSSLSNTGEMQGCFNLLRRKWVESI